MMLPFFILKVTTPTLSSLLVLLFIEALHRKNTPSWVLRKLTHLFGLLLVIFSGFFLRYPLEFWLAFLLALSLYTLLSIHPKIKFFQWFLTLISRFNETKTERKNAFLSFFFALLSLGLCYFFSLLLNESLFFLLASLPLALGDPFGEIIGRTKRKTPLRYNPRKSLQGTLGVLTSSFLILLVTLSVIPLIRVSFSQKILVSLTLSFITALIESFFNDYMDNFLIPITNFTFLVLTTKLFSFPTGL